MLRILHTKATNKKNQTRTLYKKPTQTELPALQTKAAKHSKSLILQIIQTCIQFKSRAAADAFKFRTKQISTKVRKNLKLKRYSPPCSNEIARTKPWFL